VPGVIVAASQSAWTYGGAILTFVFPMILFLFVATGLYVIYTKPSVVPGHREQTVARPIGFTPAVRLPGHDDNLSTAGDAPAAGPHYAVPSSPGSQGTPAQEGGSAGPEGAAAGPDNPEAAE
jgi:hypothetical protein